MVQKGSGMTGLRTEGLVTDGRPDIPPNARLAAEEAVEVLCRGVAQVLRVAPCTPSSVRLRFRGASVEVDWPDGGRAGAAPPAETAQEEPDDRTAVTAPLVGTCYLAPEPGAEPFVSVGDLVEPGQQVAIVEAMKLMNPVVADQRGEVAEILVGDAEPVEYGAPLVLLNPVADR